MHAYISRTYLPAGGPCAADGDCDADFLCGPYEDYIVKHPENHFQCLKCQMTGLCEEIRAKNCWPVEIPEYMAKNPRVPFKVVAVGSRMARLDDVP